MSLHNHKQAQAKQTIDDAFSKVAKELKKKEVVIGVTFSDDGVEIEIPQALMDLVIALNPVDSEKRKEITNQLFPKSKGSAS